MSQRVKAKHNNPEFLIQRRVEHDKRFTEAAKYIKQLKLNTLTTGWFESKSKYDFSDNEKRERTFVEEELVKANEELKTLRSTRLKCLYDFEARRYEDELSAMGLAIQRDNC